MARKQNSKNKAHAVTFYSYPKLLFCWPIIVMGIAFWFIPWTEGKESIGWVYLGISALVILTISVDVERNHAVFWIVVAVAIFLLGRWLSDAQHFTLFGNIYNFLDARDVNYSRGYGLAMSLILVIPYVVMIVWARMQHKWRVTHNEFEHYSFGRSDDSLARGAKRVRTTYPDLLELLLAGAGTMIVYSATGRTELRRIHHVPLLHLKRRRIDRILETTAVTTTDAAMEEEMAAEGDEEEDQSRVDDTGGGHGIGGEKL
jgi:hypothetical protein